MFLINPEGTLIPVTISRPPDPRQGDTLAWGYSKVLLAGLVTGAIVMLAVSAWQLRHGAEREVFTRSA